MRSLGAVLVLALGLVLAPPTDIVWELRQAPRLADLGGAPDLHQIKVRVTYYNLVPGQTDDTPWLGSCGYYWEWEAKLRPGERLVALSRDLFFDNRGRKLCGKRVVIEVLGERFVGVVWDTMHSRFGQSVDIAMPPGERWGRGAAPGTMFWLGVDK